MIEIIGYFASFLVILSLLMKDIYVLRVINSVAAAWFVVYGFLIESYPVIATNGLIIVINLYYLIIQHKEK